MKSKGFTLVEMIAVITLIALLTTIALPQVINQINKKKDDERDLLKSSIYAEADLYVKNNISKYNLGHIYCLSLEQLVNDDYLDKSILSSDLIADINKKQIQITYTMSNVLSYDLTSTCSEGDI